MGLLGICMWHTGNQNIYQFTLHVYCVHSTHTPHFSIPTYIVYLSVPKIRLEDTFFILQDTTYFLDFQTFDD